MRESCGERALDADDAGGQRECPYFETQLWWERVELVECCGRHDVFSDEM